MKEQYRSVETEEKIDKSFLKGFIFFKQLEEPKIDQGFRNNLRSKLSHMPRENSANKTNVFYRAPYVFAILTILIIFGYFGFFVFNKDTKLPNYQSRKDNKFVHYEYLSKPNFEKAISSAIASPNEYKLSKPLPKAQEVVKKSKISLLPQAYAGGETYLPVYRAKRHEITLNDAKQLALKFNILGNPESDGTQPPSYYGFIWNTEKEYFAVQGGSGTGGFEYYLKGPGLSGKSVSDSEAISFAKNFLSEKEIIDDSYFVSGVLYNASGISSRTGFWEDHKQVYFRKKIDSYPVYDWTIGGGSPITDKLEVWVGVGGRIIYAANNTYWTEYNQDKKIDFPLREPLDVYEDLKNGKGKLAWIDYDAIEVSTGGYGPSAPSGNFVQHGKLINVEIEGVTLAYYHEQKGIEDPEYYQPIYLFSAKATLDWKDGYDTSDAEKFIKGKRTSVTLVAPAISDTSFFDNKVEIGTGSFVTTIPVVPTVYYPSVITPTMSIITPTSIPTTQPIPTIEEKTSFILKLDSPQNLDSLSMKKSVNLNWEDVPGTVKYNIYLKIAGDSDYSQAAVAGTGGLSKSLIVNRYIDYYFKVKACKTADRCIESNEVFLPQDQKPSFNMKLGEITLKDDPKVEVVLSWEDVPGTVKYNVYLRNSLTQDYDSAIAGVSDLTYTATVNKYNDNYFMIQACSDNGCYSSNEVLLPKQ